MRLKILLAATAAMMFAGAAAGHAADYQVKTMNMTAHGMFQFDPPFLKIQPGDTVHFVAQDKGHDVESIAGMIPDGATPFKGQFNQDLAVTFTKPGVYGFKCAPHYSLGMVGLIVVGDPAANLKQAEAVDQQGRAKQAFAKLFEQAAGKVAATP